jgi:hypothetical protein
LKNFEKLSKTWVENNVATRSHVFSGMTKAAFRFYEELNAYLPVDRRKRDFELEFEDQKTLRELIESLGVPCEEVDLILANGESVGLHHVPGEGERVSVYPVFEALNISEVTRITGRPLRMIKFVLDINLTALAAYLQASGYDVHFDEHMSRNEVITISKKEKRIILSTDPHFLGSEEITHAILLPRAKPEVQFMKMMERLDIPPENTLHHRR